MLLLLLLHTVYSADIQSQKNFTTRQVDSCPDVGYYVQRDLNPNSLEPGPCFLCFCQNDGTATCWRREGWRCDVEKYHHHHVGRRDARIRRATGLGDIFFRDAARDVFNKNLPEQCKPFESSFSDGCPPVDWCIGCTVCDCDANGRWDCHVLSFCDPTTKKPSKKRKGNYRRTVIKKSPIQINKPVTSKPTAKPPLKIIRKVIRKPASLNAREKRQPRTQNVNKKNIIKNQPKKIIKIKVPEKKIIKKGIAKKPIEVNNKSNQIIIPSTPKFAQAVVQKVLEAVQQMMRNDVKKGNTSKILNAVDKKQINTQKNRKALMKRVSTIIRQGAKSVQVNSDNNIKKPARIKREIDDNENLKVISVMPILRDNTTISDGIIPIKQAETTKDIPINNIEVTFDIQTEMLTTTPTPTTIFVKEPTSFYEVRNDQSNKQKETNITTTSATIITNIPEVVIDKITNNVTTSDKWSQIMNLRKINIDIKNANESIIHVLNNMTSANDLKLKKWYKIKLLKDSDRYLQMEQVKEKDMNKLNNNISKNNSFDHFRPSVYSQDIKRKIDTLKRNKLKKLIMSPRLRKDGINATLLNKKVTTLQSIFKNILKEFNNNTIVPKIERKRFNIIKYMRNLFSYLLSKGKSNLTRSDTEILLEKQHTTDMLCEYAGTCNLNPRNSRLLDAKITQLGVETDKVLKAIKIIKGLLQLVEIPSDNEVRNSIDKPKSSLKDDVNKLNIILRDSYINDLKSELSQTQTTQINYIKKNTQEFISSIAKFGKILNEIIDILKKNNKSIKKRKVNENRKHKINNAESLQNLKKLLIRYDIMQNSFFKKIYDSLTTFEMRINKDKQKSTSVDNELKNMANIDTFSRNILTNLHKLTQLAHSVNSRTKREILRDDDAMEYLLLLMEYLLNQNYYLDAAPVNDGIDMLIEAIKNAPDIKPIRKKVLEYTPAIFPTRTVPAKIKKVKEMKLIKTTTIKKQLPVISRFDDPKFVEPIKEEKDYDDKYLYTRRSVYSDGENKANSVSIKTDVIHHYSKENSSEPSENNIEEKGIYINSESQIDNSGPREIVEEKKYDIFNADLNDFIIFASPTTPTSDATAEAGITSIIQSKITKTGKATPTIEDKKIEWIEESYEKDNKDRKRKRKQRTTNPPPAVTRTKKSASTVDDNIGSITTEVKEAEIKKKTTRAEDVAYKKQMDLLNSLDYVTEKVEFDIESKEIEDPYPSYFG